MTNESKAITDFISNWSDCKHSMTEEKQIPMMPFDAKLFPDKCSYTPSSSGVTWLHTVPQEENQASQIYSGSEQLASVAAPPAQFCTPKNICITAKKKYQCSSESCSQLFSASRSYEAQ
ncbi:hypothetical protein EI94DRAFT_1831126 [Lactarius quietus]|nr:hypothetical protein EI94DRAFT_1831126 [Lactarius quietus]